MAYKYDPTKYETVKERKEHFYKDHPDGRIIVELLNNDMTINEYASFKASVYLNGDELKNNLPKAVGYAMEVRDKEKKISSYGKEYESVNYSSWTENCEESAIGRALDNAGYSGNKKCSREEMEKAERMTNTLSKPVNQVKDDPIKGKKKTIQDLLEEQNPLLTEKEDYQNACMEKTQLELVEKNYDEIINRLKVIKSEI